MSAAAGTVLATGKQVIGEIASKASNAAAQDQAAAQKVLNDPNSTDEQKAAAKTAFNDAQKTQADWGPGGIYNRALNAGVTVLVGSLAGQTGGQIAANAMGPTVVKTVGDIGTQLQNQATKDADNFADLAQREAEKGNAAAAADYTAKASEAAATAANWGENGVYRVGLHLATQGLLSDLANGKAGALQSGAGVVSGNLSRQLAEQLGNAEADKLGLPLGAARESFVNKLAPSLAAWLLVPSLQRQQVKPPTEEHCRPLRKAGRLPEPSMTSTGACTKMIKLSQTDWQGGALVSIRSSNCKARYVGLV